MLLVHLSPHLLPVVSTSSLRKMLEGDRAITVLPLVGWAQADGQQRKSMSTARLMVACVLGMPNLEYHQHA